MAHKKKNLSPEELSAIRSRASKMRKAFRGGSANTKSDDEKLGPTTTITIGRWAMSVFRKSAADSHISVRKYIDKIAVYIADNVGIEVPDNIRNNV